MRIVDLSLSHRATVFFLMVAVGLAGLSAYLTLPRESSPDVSIPLVIAYTLYPGAAPPDVESQVTRPIERELQGLEGVKNLTSVSQESASVVTVEFVSGTDIDDALQKVRDRVDRAEADFPGDAEEPVLQEVNFSDIPVLQVNLYGDLSPVPLKRMAEDLQDRLEGIPGVLKVDLVGGMEREVRVDVDPLKLNLYGLSLDDVVDAIEDENVSIPGGDLGLGDRNYAVRVPGEVDDPREVADFVVRATGGAPVFIRDVATVSWGFADRVSHARINGQDSVALAVRKRTGANIVEVADRVKAMVSEESDHWPETLRYTILADQSKDIRRMVSELENNILSGLLLVVLVLMFVLGLRNALLVGLAIPLSMMVTFIAIQLTGTTLNMVVLFSLILAVGMLVDNAVVVIENIYRHGQEGLTPLEAAGVGTREVGAAILVSTLTTVAAFFPLLFWPGIVGDFMRYLPLTVIIALLASLLVAFTVNPVMASVFLRAGGLSPAERQRRVRRGKKVRDGGGRLAAWGDRLLSAYRRLLVWSLDHRAVVVAGTVGLFLAMIALFAVFNHGHEFFPETEPRQVYVNVKTPSGTRLDKTDAVVQDIENRLTEVPDLKVMAAGSGVGSQVQLAGQEEGDDTRGRVTLDLLDRDERSQNSFDTMEQVRATTDEIPGVTIEIAREEEGPPVGKPVVLEITGDDFEVLGRISEQVLSLIEDVPDLVSLESDFDLARPELTVAVDRTQAARLGLTTRDVAATVRTAVNGTEASVYRYGEDEADITVRLQEASRGSIGSLESLRIVTPGGAQVPLSSVARVDRTSALTSINHKDQKRMVTIEGDVTSPEKAEPVRQEVRRLIEETPGLLPAGYQVSFAGAQQDEQEAQAFLSRAFLYAVILVLALMVAKFDSLAIPLIIISSVIMSTMGVLLGLMVTGLPFGIVMTGLGVISLAGIVVNNAIVLLDYAEQLRAQGWERRKLVVETGLTRLRPVLLTAVTTILGLIPLSTGIEIDFFEGSLSTGGESSQWWSGMGVAVIFGLAFATFLTLVLVPVLYDLLLGFKERRANRRDARLETERRENEEALREEAGRERWESEPAASAP